MYEDIIWQVPIRVQVTRDTICQQRTSYGRCCVATTVGLSLKNRPQPLASVQGTTYHIITQKTVTSNGTHYHQKSSSYSFLFIYFPFGIWSQDYLVKLQICRSRKSSFEVIKKSVLTQCNRKLLIFIFTIYTLFVFISCSLHTFLNSSLHIFKKIAVYVFCIICSSLHTFS